ncbi:MAG: hypothetical protein ABGX68_07505 [Methylococcales bacterium]
MPEIVFLVWKSAFNHLSLITSSNALLPPGFIKHRAFTPQQGDQDYIPQETQQWTVVFIL